MQAKSLPVAFIMTSLSVSLTAVQTKATAKQRGKKVIVEIIELAPALIALSFSVRALPAGRQLVFFFDN
jgi:hypothetical protein